MTGKCRICPNSYSRLILSNSIFQEWMADRLDPISTTLAFHTFAFYSFLSCVILWPLTFPGYYCYFSLVPASLLLIYSWRSGPLGGKIFKEVSPLLQLWFDPKDDDLREKAIRELSLLTHSLVTIRSGMSDTEVHLDDCHCNQIIDFLISLKLTKHTKKFVDAGISFDMLEFMHNKDFTALGNRV